MEDNLKYFQPEISDIRVGYECELLWNQNMLPEDSWYNIKVWEDGTEEFDIIDWIGKIENSKLRVPYLTQEQIESCGFTLKAKSIDSWFEINEDKRFDTDLQNFGGYKCYNVFLNYGFHDHMLKIKGDFTGGSKFDGAETLFEGECKCINELRQILKQIHITPFYG